MKKHRILKELQKIYIEKSNTTSNTTEFGKSLSTEALHNKTKFSLEKLNLLLSSLKFNEYINSTNITGKGDTIFWFITDKGRDALSNNEFVWYSKIDNWHKILTVLIALLALLNSIFGFIWLGDKTLK